MTSINLIHEIKRRRKAIAAAEGGDGTPPGGLAGFMAKLKAGGGESGIELSGSQKFGLAILLLGIVSYTQYKLVINQFYINEKQAAAETVREQVRGEMNEWEQKLRAFDSIKAEIQSFEGQMSELRQKLAVIENMQKGRSSVVRMIDFMVREMPDEIWLTDVTVDVSGEVRKTGKIGKVDMSGNSVSLQQLSAFIERLEKGVFFTKWNLQETTAQTAAPGTSGQAGMQFKTFKIDAEVQSL